MNLPTNTERRFDMRKLKPTKKAKSKLKISACYMVKNEEENLPRSLESVKLAADEIIVVDTGSTDRTIEIAESYGARIIQTPWKDDFSTPRNMAIDAATGDWIIFLDADEYFSSPDKVHSAIAKLSDSTTIIIPRIDIDEEQGRELNHDWSMRVFRNVDYLRYRGLIHEHLTNIKDGKMPYIFGSGDLTIYHTGYAASKIKQKLQRNLELIEQEEKSIGHKPQHDITLADCYMGLGDYEKVIQHVKKALNSSTRELTGRGRLYRNLMNAMRNLNQSDEEVLKVIEEANRTLPQLPEFYAERAITLCDLNRLNEAYDNFKRSLEMWENMSSDTYENSYYPRIIDVVYAQLAELERLKGNIKEAKRNIAEAIKIAPYNQMYQNLSAQYQKVK